MKKSILFYIVCVSLLNLLATSVLAAPKINIDKYIQSDFLAKEIELKSTFQTSKLKKLYSQKKKEFQYPSYDDFWRFAFEYWMVKNAKYLKWDQAIENEQINQEFKKLIKKTKLKVGKFKIFILPTSWISHFALPLGGGDFYFFISQQFIKESGINASQASLVFLDEYIKLKNGFLLSFLQDTNFVKKLGRDFYLNKKPDIPGFEKLIEKISYFFRFYGYQFGDAFQSYQDIKLIASKHDQMLQEKFTKTYKLIYSSRKKLVKKFPRILGLYPSTSLYHSWFQK